MLYIVHIIQVQDPVDAERQSVESSSRPSRSSRSTSGTAKPTGSSSSGLREQSANKAQDWVNGIWPSWESLATTSKPSDNTGNKRNDQDTDESSLYSTEKVDYRTAYHEKDNSKTERNKFF